MTICADPKYTIIAFPDKSKGYIKILSYGKKIFYIKKKILS